MNDGTLRYVVRTHADREFDHYLGRVSCLHSWYESDDVQVIEFSVPFWYAGAFERMMDSDGAVISYWCPDEEE
ncbi:MAG: hypothetical protein RML84_11365 [Anaerolineae bacterium]|nr:hypothetical protein [Anaerolineae bacterium]